MKHIKYITRILTLSTLVVACAVNAQSVSKTFSIGSTYKNFTAPIDGAIIEGQLGVGVTNPPSKVFILDTSDASAYHTNIVGKTSRLYSASVPGGLGNTLALSNEKTVDGNYQGINFRNANGYPVGVISSINTSHTSNTGELAFAISNNNSIIEHLRIDKDGHVGIGNTTPICKLDVIGTARITERFLMGSKVNLTSNLLYNQPYLAKMFLLNRGIDAIADTFSGTTYQQSIAIQTTASKNHISGNNYVKSMEIYTMVDQTDSDTNKIYNNLMGVRSAHGIYDKGTVNNSYGFVSYPILVKGGTIVGNQYDFYASYSGLGTGANLGSVGRRYGIYIEHPGDNYFSGNLGVGISVPTEKLQVGGNIVPSVDNSYSLGKSGLRFTEVFAANGVINTSDVRQKKNINNLSYGLDAVMKLRPVSYNWKTGDQSTKLGFIAQELEKVLPEVVKVNEDKDKTYGVYYSDIIPVLTKAIQEQQGIIEQLKQQNTTLEQRIKALESK